MLKSKTLTGLLTAAILFVGQTAHTAATCQGAELIKPGKLVVAFNGDMPGIPFHTTCPTVTSLEVSGEAHGYRLERACVKLKTSGPLQAPKCPET